MSKIRLPNIKSLKNEEQILCYKFDKLEMFNSNKKVSESLKYKNRLNKIIHLIKKYSRGKKILDLAAGHCNIALSLAECGYNVTAVDLRKSFLDYAKLKYEYGKINYIPTNIENLSSKEKFDVIILGEILEHLAKPQKILQKCKLFLKENGILVITTPNGDFIGNKLISYSEAQSMNLMEKQYAVDKHVFLFKIKEFKQFLNSLNYKPIHFSLLNTLFINRRMYNFYRILPLILIKFIDFFFSKIPMLNKKISSNMIYIAKSI